jgi:hypothetical protein
MQKSTILLPCARDQELNRKASKKSAA